jgi:hypothetical protein
MCMKEKEAHPQQRPLWTDLRGHSSPARAFGIYNPRVAIQSVF